MKLRQELKQLRIQQNGKDLKDKFPILKKNTTNVLFIQCVQNRDGILRSFLPYQMLNDTETHSALIANLHQLDYKKENKGYDNVIYKELIEWANIVVFPATFYDLTSTINEMLSYNDRLGFVMDIDKNYFVQRGKPANITVEFWKNISEMDIITVPNSYLLKLYSQHAQALQLPRTPYFDIIPSLITPEWNRNTIIKQHSDIIRVGILKRDFSEQLKNALSDILKNIPHEIAVLESKRNTTKVQDLNVRDYNFRSYLDYLDLLGELQLDVVLLPYSFKSQEKALSPYVEFAMQGTPVITNSNAPFAHLITNGENGFIVEQEEHWKRVIEEVLHNRIYLNKVGQYARRFTLKHFCWNRQKTKMLVSLLH